MAQTKAAAAAALSAIDLTKPKHDDGGKLRVDGYETLASEYRDTQREIELLQEQQKERKRQLVDAIGKQRLKEEKAGNFYKTAVVPTDTDEVLYVSWGDRYRTLDQSHQPLLKRAVGKHYDTLFTETVSLKPDDGITLEDIQVAVGARFEALNRLVKMTPAIKLQSGFMEMRADLRHAFDAPTNDSIDTVVAQVQSDPTVKIVAPKE